MSFTDYTSKIRIPDCSKLAINWKNGNDVTIFWLDVIIKFFWRCFVSLVKFSYLSKFYVNIITGSGVMRISFYKGLTRNPEIGNTPIWVLPNIRRLRRVKNIKFGTNVSNKILPNAAKCQNCSFYGFWAIKGKPMGRGGKITSLPPRSELNINDLSLILKYSKQNLQSLYLLLLSHSARLLARLDRDLAIIVTKFKDILSYVIFYHFHVIFPLILKHLSAFLCFLQVI